MPDIPIGLSNTPFYLRDRPNKQWAIEQERYRHDQALYSIGEPVMFVLMWHLEDHRNGYVRRCPECDSGVYDQPNRRKCPLCYGTTFEGGVRAKIIRDAVVTDSDDDESASEHGETYSQRVSIESSSDFRFRSGDYMFRADGSRWQLSSPVRSTVRVGYAHPTQAQDSMGYASGQASLEDQSSVAFMIPPSASELQALLTSPQNYPSHDFDRINAPLIPKGWTD